MEPHAPPAPPPEPAVGKSHNSELPLNPHKPREEGEVSSDDNDENRDLTIAHSTGISIPPKGPMNLPPVSKITQGNEPSRALFGSNPASSRDIQPHTSMQPTSQKSNDTNRAQIKPAIGWRAPTGPNNLVINFSDDDSQSDSEEKDHGKRKALQTKSHVTRVVNNVKRPISSLAASNKSGQTSKNMNKVMPKKLSANRTFVSSMAKINGFNPRDSGPSVAQVSRARNFSSANKNIMNRERGHELQDLRHQIALKETELKLKESEMKLKSAQRTKESVACKDDKAGGLHRDRAGKCTTGFFDVMQIEPKEPDKKRMKVSDSFSTLIPQEVSVAKCILPSKDPAVEDNSPLDTGMIDQLRKKAQITPTESSIVRNYHNDKHVAGVSGNIHTGVKDGALTNARYIQSEGRRKLMDPYVAPSHAMSLANMTCNDFPINLNSVELNHTNMNRDHIEPDSIMNKSMPGKNLMRSGDHQQAISSDKALDPSFYNIHQVSLNNGKISTCVGNENATGHGNTNIHSLVQMEELLDKDLEEAQEYRRRCEIEEKNSLKAYRKAQRDLLEANARCDDLYRKRELYSADLRAYLIDNSSLLWSSRKNGQAGVLLDNSNNISENANLIPDASTSDPAPLLGNNGPDGVCSPSTEPNSSANEDEDTFSFEHESVQPNIECRIVDKQKETDKESNSKLSIEGAEESLLLEKALRSTLFAKLGTKNLSKKGTEPAVEQGDESDIRIEERQKTNGSFPFSEAEKNQQSDIEGTDRQDKSFCEAPPEILREHSIENNSLNSHSSGYVEDRYSFNAHQPLTSVMFSPSYILRSAFGCMKVVDPNNWIERQGRCQQSETCDINIEDGARINSGKTQFSSTLSDPMKETQVTLCGKEVGSYTTSPSVDLFWPLCMYELRGKCNNDECPWQHIKDYSSIDMSQHPNEDITADCDGGLIVLQHKSDDYTKAPWRHSVTSPTYLVGLSILKADPHSYESVLAGRNGENWKKCFSLFLTLSKLFQKDFPAEEQFLPGTDGRIEVPVSWNRQSSYFQSRNRRVNQADQAFADNEQYLENALLIFSQEANALEGMKKALPVLSRALEADPTSVLLWVFYLLIYYSNMKSVGKDDMFSCAVNYNDQAYELWIMFINSRMQLGDRLAAYDLALSALSCHAALASAKDRTHGSACIVDVVLQMLDCLCISGNVEKAVQKACGLFSAATSIDDSSAPCLTDILKCLTVYDKCILGVCCVYLVIYRKLPDVVVQQFECPKELVEIEWPSVQLTDNGKQSAVKIMEAVVDSVDSLMKCQSPDKDEINLSLGHFIAVNHLRCMSAIGSLESCSYLLGKYLKLFPSCLELVLISTWAQKHDLGDSFCVGFEEALSNWPKEVPGIECIWNQYVEYALQNGRFDLAKELLDRWFHSVWQVRYTQNGTLDVMECDNSDGSLGLASEPIQTPNTNPTQMDVMFGCLNLALHKLLLNDRMEAHIALDRALKAAVPKYYKHCVREHALFMLTEESTFKDNCSASGMQNILEQYLGDAQAFLSPKPLSRQFVADIKKLRVRQLVSNVFSSTSSDFSLVNTVLEVWYGPSLLPNKIRETKCLVDFVEAILDVTPSNYQLASSVCKLLSSENDATGVVSNSILFWACSNLVSAIFHAVPIPPEYVWVEAAEILGDTLNVEVISERFYKRALSVYPFSVKLWKSYYRLSKMTPGNLNSVLEAAKEKGIELD